MRESFWEKNWWGPYLCAVGRRRMGLGRIDAETGGEGDRARVSARLGVVGGGLVLRNIQRFINTRLDIKPRCLAWRGGCLLSARAHPLDSSTSLVGRLTAWFGSLGKHKHTHNAKRDAAALSRLVFSPKGSACLIFRHVQLCGFTDCFATCSNPSCITIACKMPTGGWP